MLMDPSPPEWLKRQAAPTGVRREFLARVIQAAGALIAPSDNPSAYCVCKTGLDVGTTLAQEDGVHRNLETIEFFSGWGVYSYWARYAGLRSREYDARTRHEVGNLAKAPGIAYAVYLTNSIVPRGTVLMSPPLGHRDISEFEFSVVVHSVASVMFLTHLRGAFYIVQVPRTSQLLKSPPVLAAIGATHGSLVRTMYVETYKRVEVATVLLSNMPSQCLAHLEDYEGCEGAAAHWPNEDVSVETRGGGGW